MPNSVWVDFSLDETSIGVLADGSAAAPTLTFAADTSCGLYRIGTENVGAVAGGALVWDWNTTRMLLSTGYVLQAGANTLIASDKLAASQLLIASQAIGDLLYANSSTTFTRLADVAVNQVLVSGGVGVAPAWSGTPTLASVTTTGAVAAGSTSTVGWTSRSLLSSPADAQANLTNAAAGAGIGFDVSTDAVLKIRTRAQSGYGTVDCLGLKSSGSAGASGTGTVLTQLTVVNGIVTSITIA